MRLQTYCQSLPGFAGGLTFLCAVRDYAEKIAARLTSDDGMRNAASRYRYLLSHAFAAMRVGEPSHRFN